MTPDHTPLRLAALVVTYNRLPHLQLTVQRLLASGADVLEKILVVDNASTDGTSEWLAAQSDPRLQVLNCGQNIGGAGGFAAGLAQLMPPDGTATDMPDWVVVMDDDGRPVAGALEQFVAVDRSTKDQWFAAVYFPDGRVCGFNRPWINPFRSWRGFWSALRAGRGGFHLDDAAYAAPHPMDIDGGSFVGQFMSRTAVQRAGLPRGDLFIYGDDVLFSLAVGSAGGQAGFDPAVRFEHDCETEAVDDGRIRPMWKLYFLYRNQLMVYARAAGPLLFWPIVLGIILPGWWLRARRYGADRAAYRRLMRAAVRDGLRGDTTHGLAYARALAQGDPL